MVVSLVRHCTGFIRKGGGWGGGGGLPSSPGVPGGGRRYRSLTVSLCHYRRSMREGGRYLEIAEGIVVQVSVEEVGRLVVECGPAGKESRMERAMKRCIRPTTLDPLQ